MTSFSRRDSQSPFPSVRVVRRQPMNRAQDMLQCSIFSLTLVLRMGHTSVLFRLRTAVVHFVRQKRKPGSVKNKKKTKLASFCGLPLARSKCDLFLRPPRAPPLAGAVARSVKGTWRGFGEYIKSPPVARDSRASCVVTVTSWGHVTSRCHLRT